MSIYSDVSHKYKIIINLEREIINKKINVSKLKNRFLVFKYYLNTRKLAQYLNKRY